MKLLLTVGAQMPFDRLVAAVDAWMASATDVVAMAQIGPTDFQPKYMRFTQFLEPAEFGAQVEACTAIVAHAGMGSIIMALQHRKPILVMPRRGALRETRNDHQVATALAFKQRGDVQVAMDEAEVGPALDRLRAAKPGAEIPPYASEELITALRHFIHADRRQSDRS